ncbi:MAG: hypothetical protein ACRCYI_07050, partial [Plesiomonas shigelloides]
QQRLQTQQRFPSANKRGGVHKRALKISDNLRYIAQNKKRPSYLDVPLFYPRASFRPTSAGRSVTARAL